MKMTNVFAAVVVVVFAGCAGATKPATEPDDVLELKAQAKESEKLLQRKEDLIKAQAKERADCEKEIAELEKEKDELEKKNKSLLEKAEKAIAAVEETEATLADLYGEPMSSPDAYYDDEDEGEEEYEETEVYDSSYGSTVVTKKKSYKSETYVVPYPGASFKPEKYAPPLPEKRVFVEGYLDAPKPGSKLNVKITAEKVKKNTFFRLWVGKYEVTGDGFGDMAYVLAPSGKKVIATVIKPGEVIYVPVMNHGPHSVYVQECNMTFDPVSGSEVCVATSENKRLVDTIKDAAKSAAFLMYYD